MLRTPTSIITLFTTAIALGLGLRPDANAAPLKDSSRAKGTPKASARSYSDRQNRGGLTRPLDQPVKGRTPYDPYFGPVRTVLQNLDGRNPPSMANVSLLMRRAFQFEYSMTSFYRPKSPAAVERRQAGDCKDKALWLADRMNDPGIHYVIGKGSTSQSLNHAWLLWKYRNQWWVLDPTVTGLPQPAESLGPRYIPYYAYTRESAYRYRTTELKTLGVGVHDRRKTSRRRP